jgi:hypothetical protein
LAGCMFLDKTCSLNKAIEKHYDMWELSTNTWFCTE